MAKIWGLLAMQLANAHILPFDYATYAADLVTPLKPLQNSSIKKQEIDNVDFGFTGRDVQPPTTLIERLANNRKTEWEAAATAPHQAFEIALASGNVSNVAAINRRLYQLERRLTSEAGLPLRPWFKHLIYAPGLNTGYAAVIFPGVHDALAAGDDTQVRAQLAQLAEAFQRIIQGIHEIREILSDD